MNNMFGLNNPPLNPISDNFVVGDNVYLNELKNFFFEVLGMMSITHYGAIGDGRTDNYAYLQVAIDDANRRGLCYLYVPYGRYRYRGQLLNPNNVIFIGNPRAKIFNDRTGEEIEIKQFGVPGCGEHSCKMTFLEANIVLVDGTIPELKTGSYFTDAYVVKINGNVVIPKGCTFYYDGSTRTLSWLTGYAKYENGVWVIEEGPAPEEDDEMKAIMTASLYGEPTHPESADGNIELSNFILGGTMTDLLTLENGKIVIGEDVTQIKVSAMLIFTPAYNAVAPATHETRQAKIFRDRSGSIGKLAEGSVRYVANDSGDPITIAIAPKLVSVMEGDEISLSFEGFDLSDYFETYTFLTVEVVTVDDGNTPHPDLSDVE